MKRYIHIKKADREFILNLFKVSGRMVDYALRFDGERGNTELAHKIRKVAMMLTAICASICLMVCCWSLRKKLAMVVVMFITKVRWFVTMTM